MPEIFPTLRVLIDDQQSTRRFLILGSASRDLIKQASETLAGRIRYVELTPFQLSEVDDWQQLWSRRRLLALKKQLKFPPVFLVFSYTGDAFLSYYIVICTISYLYDIIYSYFT